MGEYSTLIRKALKRGDYRRLLLSMPEILVLRAWLRLHWHDKDISSAKFWRMFNRACSRILWTFLHWKERAYAKYFQRFEAALGDTPVGSESPRGVLLMLGTLGPGGAERQAVITMLGLARRGLEPLGMAAMHLESETQRFFLPRLEAAGLSVAELERQREHDTTDNLLRIRRAIGALPERLSEVMNFARTLVRRNPRVVHLWLDEVNIQGGLAAVAAGVPRIVLHLRSLPPYHFTFYKSYMLEAYRWLAAHPAVILAANSGAGARAYEEWIGLPTGRIRVIYNGFDFDQDLAPIPPNQRLEYRASRGIPSGAPLVGTVIRFSGEKRPWLWMDIAEQVLRAVPDAHFLMVGDGPLRQQIARRAGSSALAGRLHVVGRERQALTAISTMDIFLLTSCVEGLPNVLIEAQAQGVPVVTTQAGGAAETLQHERTGWVLQDESPEAAAAVISRLLGDKVWLQEAGKAAREFVHAHFSVECMLEETLRAYGDFSGMTAAG